MYVSTNFLHAAQSGRFCPVQCVNGTLVFQTGRNKFSSLHVVRWRKTLLRYRLDTPLKLGYSNWGLHIASVYQQYEFKFKTREEDPSQMNAFQRRDVKLLVGPIEQGISCFEQYGSRQQSQYDKEPTTSNAEEPYFNHQTIKRYISVNLFSRSTENDPFVHIIANDDVLSNNIRREY